MSKNLFYFIIAIDLLAIPVLFAYDMPLTAIIQLVATIVGAYLIAPYITD